jgi:serine/threonine protein kinase/tetratricopeptide (TPR) repeat protein
MIATTFAQPGRRRIMPAAPEFDRPDLHARGPSLESSFLAPCFPAAGTTFDGFDLLTEIGQGIEGRVFLARQNALADRPVVLKMMSCNGREHIALAQLFHPHIVPLYSMANHPEDNLRVLCMPYLGGATLEQVLDALQPLPLSRRHGRDVLAALDRLQAGSPVPVPVQGQARALLEGFSYPETVCWLAACLAEALQFAHERQMVHLDIKPSNILLAGDGKPLLLDFHIAQAPLPTGVPLQEWFGGTPGFMSPEQQAVFALNGKPVQVPVDGRSDVYSLGLVVYHCLAGCPGEPAEGRLPVYRCNPKVSRGLSDIIDRCLAADPARRYQQAGDLAHDLRLHLAQRPLRGVPNRSLGERWQKWRRRRPDGLVRLVLSAVAAGALLLTGVLTAAYLDDGRREGERALAQAQALLGQNQTEVADQVLAQGLRRAVRSPGSAGLLHRLAEEKRRSQRIQLRRELAKVVEGLRFQCDPETLPPTRLRIVADRCRQLWDNRRIFLDEEGEGQADAAQVYIDLLDLAILSADLQVRLAPEAEKHTARAQALSLLDEAQALFGSSAIVQHEHRRHWRALHDQEGDGAKEIASSAEQPPAPRTAWEYYALARAWLQVDELDRAAAALDRALHLQPQGFWPNFYRGVCAYRRGRHVEAYAAFEVCAALQPETAACYYHRALAAAALGQFANALRDYDRTVKADPEFAPAWLNRGLLHYQARDYASALADLQQALEQGAPPVVTHYNLALVHQARHDYPAAIEHLRQTLGLQPDHGRARLLLKELLARRGP